MKWLTLYGTYDDCSTVLPRTPEEISNGSFYTHTFQTQPLMKVGAKLLETLHKGSLLNFSAVLNELIVSPGNGATVADATFLLSLLHKSSLGRGHGADLFLRENRIVSPVYRCVAAYLLNLPPPAKHSTPVWSAEHGATLDTCREHVGPSGAYGPYGGACRAVCGL